MLSIKTVVFRNDFARIAVQIKAGAGVATREAADEIVAMAKDLVPVRTGALGDSIEAGPGGAGGGYQVRAGNDEVDYAAYVEFGTVNMAAEPFFWPAVEHVSMHWEEICETAIFGGLKL
jgi:HK97 gp10 family phage protein